MLLDLVGCRGTSMASANRIVQISAVPPSTLKLTFADGNRADVDIRTLLVLEAFRPLSDAAYFAQAQIDEEGGVFWPNGADISPEYLEEVAASSSRAAG